MYIWNKKDNFLNLFIILKIFVSTATIPRTNFTWQTCLREESDFCYYTILKSLLNITIKAFSFYIYVIIFTFNIAQLLIFITSYTIKLPSPKYKNQIISYLKNLVLLDCFVLDCQTANWEIVKEGLRSIDR